MYLLHLWMTMTTIRRLGEQRVRIVVLCSFVSHQVTAVQQPDHHDYDYDDHCKQLEIYGTPA